MCENSLLNVKTITSLLTWYRENKRVLPWRENRTPYRVWISEIMLQQTRVVTVITYYQNWMQKWPNITALAAAEEGDVLKGWEGLGYYTRARNILKTAKQVTATGNQDLPTSYEELRLLPGIGDYTAAAISSHCSNALRAAVDANVLRVIARLMGIPWTRSNTKDQKACQAILEDSMQIAQHLPNFTAGQFNEALIELGALCCQAKTADCSHCPWRDECIAKASGDPYYYPLVPDKKARPVELFTVLILKDVVTGEIAVQQRPESGLLASLWQFPLLEGLRDLSEITLALEEMGILVLSGHLLQPRKHVFSHLEWQFQPILCNITRTPDASFDAKEAFLFAENYSTYTKEPITWMNETQVNKLAFSSAFSPLRDIIFWT